jgi:hypothetical protein
MEVIMLSYKNVFIFLAGAAFFHTINHAVLPFYVELPFDVKFMVLTQTMNIWIILVSALLTFVFLWLASRCH